MAKNQQKIQVKGIEIDTFKRESNFLLYTTPDGKVRLEIFIKDENIWLTQKLMAELYGVSIPAINQHLKKLTEDGEISDSVIKQYLITATDGKEYKTAHYNLQAIISVGFKIENERATDDRILKTDVSIAKNYLNQKEMSYLERIVSVYLDFAELQAERKVPMSMEDWARRLDSFLEFNGNQILTDAGKISHEQAKLHAETQFEKYRVTQDKLFESDFDRFMQLEKVSELRNKKQS